MVWERFKQAGTTTQCVVTILFVSLEVTAKYQRKMTTLAQTDITLTWRVRTCIWRSTILPFYDFQVKSQDNIEDRQILFKQAIQLLIMKCMNSRWQLNIETRKWDLSSFFKITADISRRKHQTFRSAWQDNHTLSKWLSKHKQV